MRPAFLQKAAGALIPLRFPSKLRSPALDRNFVKRGGHPEEDIVGACSPCKKDVKLKLGEAGLI